MSKLALRSSRLTIYQWLIAQICVVILISLLSFFIHGLGSIGATLLGALICIIPQAFFARIVFSYYRVNQLKQIVHRFYIAEILKLLLTVLLFVMALIKWPAWVLELFLGFIGAQIAFWFAPYLAKIRVKKV